MQTALLRAARHRDRVVAADTLTVDVGGVQAAASAVLAKDVRLAGASTADLRVSPHDAVGVNVPYPAPGYLVADRPWSSRLGQACWGASPSRWPSWRSAGWHGRRRAPTTGYLRPPPAPRTTGTRLTPSVGFPVVAFAGKAQTSRIRTVWAG